MGILKKTKIMGGPWARHPFNKKRETCALKNKKGKPQFFFHPIFGAHLPGFPTFD